MPGPYAKAAEVQRVLLELRHVTRAIITEPMFEPVPYGSWVDVYKAVLVVAEARGEHPGPRVLKMYTEDVRRSLGELPTPPWHAQAPDPQPSVKSLFPRRAALPGPD